MNNEIVKQPIKTLRSNKSFIIRNRTLTAKQAEIYNVAYKKWGLDHNHPWNFKEIFKNDNPVVLEIGFGRGDTLIENATINNNLNYIGIEVYQAGILHVLAAINGLVQSNSNNENINIRVCNSDANLVLKNCLQDRILSGVQIFFPDPWPKRKHKKRRLIQEDFLNLLAMKIQPGGILHLATDWQDYALQMLQLLNNNSNYSNLNKNSGYSEKADRLLTKFEARGLKMGYDVFDLKFMVL